MRITLTQIPLQTLPGDNQTVNLSWKIEGQPDSSYTALPNATVNPAGNIISPNPYTFLTGTTFEDIRVRAINTCNNSTVTALFDGFAEPIWVEYTFACEQDTASGLVDTYEGFSSPIGMAYDSTTARFFVVDSDDTGGNFFSFNPDTITNYSSVTHIAGSNTDINTFIVDRINRRIIAAGDGSGGAKVLNMATSTVTDIPYGNNAAPGTGRRTPVALSDNFFYAFCSSPNVVRRYNRGALTFVDEINKTTIPSNNMYLVNGYSVNFIGDEIWVGATARGNSNIARYSADFLTLIGTISLPGATIPTTGWTAFSAFWQTHYYDSENNRYYVSDLGSRNIYVINTITRDIVLQFQITSTRGKNYTSCSFIKNELDGKIYLSVSCINNLGDSTANFKLYKLDPITGEREIVFPNSSGSQLTLRPGTQEQWAVSPGLRSWDSPNTNWNIDGRILKYI